MKAIVLAGILTLLLGHEARATDPLLNPGKWRITVKVTIVGAPVNVPPTTVERCITPDQAANPVPEDPGDNDCKTSDFEIDGKKVRWKIRCEKQDMNGRGEIEYRGDMYEGDVNLTSPTLNIIQKINGERIGDCDATSK